MTSSGVGSRASSVAVPKRMSSRSAQRPASDLVESTVRMDVGLRPVTETGVVENSHENAIASGESLTVAYAFSDGEACAP
jgi:hypothetical protein